MTTFRFDLEFTADGRTHIDEFNLQATDRAAAERESDGILYAAPTRFYDRTGRLYADGELVAEYREKTATS